MKLNNKVIVVTGATGGLGKAIVERLSHEECKISMLARNYDKLKQIAKKIELTNSSCIFHKCNVQDKKDVKHAIDITMEEYSRIDIAILTAGVLIPNYLESFNSKIFEDTIQTNFIGNVYFFEYLFQVMKHQKSGIISAVSTLPDKRGLPGIDAYGSSKAALGWLIESLRVEAKQKFNIDLITIKPGSIETPMIGEYHRPGSISPRKAADIIIDGLKKKKRIIQFPMGQVIMVKIREMLPAFAYDIIPIHLLKEED